MKYKHRLNALYASIAVAITTMCGSAAAQEAVEPQAGATPAQTQAERRATELDTVTVTSERREQNLQKYAGTAQVLSSEDLRGMGLNELRDIQVAVPGLNISNQEGAVEVYIRGVGSANNTELGDPAAATHINGIYLPRPRGLGTMFYDLERVEVNKGPQGTLRGRNAVAGTIDLVTKKPVLGTTEGYVQFGVGNRDSRDAEAALNVPLGEVAALRFAGYSLDKGSAMKNVGLDRSLKPAGHQDEYAGRVSLLVQPNEQLSIFAMADYGHEGGTGYPAANNWDAITNAYAQGVDVYKDMDYRKVVYRGWQGDLDSDYKGFQTKIDYDFGAVTLEYNGSYRDLDFEQTNGTSDSTWYPGRDVSQTDYDNYTGNFWQTLSKATIHELRLFSSDPDARLNWTAGAFYFNEDQKSGYFSLVDKGTWYSGDEWTMPKVKAKSTAAYVDGTFSFTDRFRGKAGIRYTKEEKSRFGLGGSWAFAINPSGDGATFEPSRIGTPGFKPAMLNRPNMDLRGMDYSNFNTQEWVDFYLQGAQYGSRDNLPEQLQGLLDGSIPYEDWNGIVNAPRVQDGRAKANYFDWRAGFEYDLSDKNLLYGTISTGHRAGGFNDTLPGDPFGVTYDPEKLTSFEVGSKNVFDLAGHRATLNLSAFYYKYDDQVLQTLAAKGEDSFVLLNENVAQSNIYGIEASGMFSLPAGFYLDVNALWTKSKIDSGTITDARSIDYGNDSGGRPAEIDLSGNSLPLVSEFNLSARLMQTIYLSRGSFDWQILGSYRSSYYLSAYNLDDVVKVDAAGDFLSRQNAAAAGFPDKQEGFVTFNLGVGYTPDQGNWRVEGWVSNLTDKQVSQKALVGSTLDMRFLNDARYYGVRVRVNF